MDMSFALMEPRRPVSIAATMDDIRAEADRRKEAVASMPAVWSGHLRGQGSVQDHVLALAQLAVSGASGSVDAVWLAGSFCPSVADQIMVGKRR